MELDPIQINDLRVFPSLRERSVSPSPPAVKMNGQVLLE
jgi:hypothetical protein